jgi:hypothetical protein
LHSYVLDFRRAVRISDNEQEQQSTWSAVWISG